MILNQFYDSQRMFKKDLLKYKPFRTGLPALLSFVQNVKERSIKQRICCFSIRQVKKNLT